MFKICWLFPTTYYNMATTWQELVQHGYNVAKTWQNASRYLLCTVFTSCIVLCYAVLWHHCTHVPHVMLCHAVICCTTSCYAKSYIIVLWSSVKIIRCYLLEITYIKQPWIYDCQMLQNRLLLQREDRREGLVHHILQGLAPAKNSGQFHQLMEELMREDVASLQNLPVDTLLFQELEDRLAPRTPGFRRHYHLVWKLEAVTLWHIATGDRYYSFTISYMIKEDCKAIVVEYTEEVPQHPHCPRWVVRCRTLHQVAISPCYWHIRWEACGHKKTNGKSMYFNFKRYHSIALMALVDTD